MKTIAICNHKGGVGKTALSMAIAEGLHRKGKRTSCNSKCDEFNIIAPNGRDKSTLQAACENLFVDRIATQIAPPFDSPTTLRVSLKTLRVIEMSKAVYLSRSHHEKIRRCRMLRPKPSAIGEASHRFAPGLARSPLRGTSNTRHPSHSQYRFALATANS